MVGSSNCINRPCHRHWIYLHLQRVSLRQASLRQAFWELEAFSSQPSSWQLQQLRLVWLWRQQQL